MFIKKDASHQKANHSFIEAPGYKSISEQIHDLSGLPREHYDLFYKSTLNRFLSRTQHCSEEELIEHLNAVVRALKLRRALILPLGSDAECINKQKDLWTYAIFVGALMYKSHKLIAKQALYRHRNDYLKLSPFDVPIPHDCDIQELESLEITPYSTGVFLPLIFCPVSLSWLYRDRHVFNTALELAQSPNPQTRLGQLILLAHQDGNDQSSTQKTPSAASSPQQEDTVETCQSSPSYNTPPFQKWLKETIENNRLPQFICETIDGHAMADPAIFEAYCKEVNHPNPLKIRSDFFALERHQSGASIKFSGGPIKKAIYITDISAL